MAEPEIFIAQRREVVANVPNAPSAPAAAASPRASRRWGDAPFAVAALAAGVVGWGIGGYYTLVALAWLGVPVAPSVPWAWLIPLGVSALEIGFSRPHRRHGWPVLLFVFIVLLDCGSTALGLHTRFVGAVVGDVVLSASHPLLLGGSVVAALILTFFPEAVILGALVQLKSIVWG